MDLKPFKSLHCKKKVFGKAGICVTVMNILRGQMNKMSTIGAQACNLR